MISEDMAPYFKQGIVVDMVKSHMQVTLHFREMSRATAQVHWILISRTGHQLAIMSWSPSTHYFYLADGDLLASTKSAKDFNQFCLDLHSLF